MAIIFLWIDRLKGKIFIRLLYWSARIGMALTFILSGFRKMPGMLFTVLPDDDPVGAYFYAMHETGFYWNFIGYFQILIGVLLFFNRFVVPAALLMMPVTINIFLVSVSLHMIGTPVITSCMVLGNLLIMLWHYNHYLPILKRPESQDVRLLPNK